MIAVRADAQVDYRLGDVSLTVGKHFGTSAELWLGLQMDYDIRRAKRETWPTVERRIRRVKAA